jgi:hypothetical protein
VALIAGNPNALKVQQPVLLWALLIHNYGDNSRLTGERLVDLVNNSTYRRRYTTRCVML